MIKDVQYTWAVDENGSPVHIDDAVKGISYFCPGCESKFTLKDSGKTGPGSKRKHYSHSSNANCSGESYLHKMFIKRVAALLEEYQSEGKALEVNWTCRECHSDYSKHNFNILAKTARIESEYPLEGYRPDIALLDAEGKVIGAIEIVYKHEPEEGVLGCYKKLGITMIQINLFFEVDLDRVEQKIIRPDIVNLCLNQKCSNFSNHETGRKLLYSEVPCPRCGNPARTCQVEANSVFGAIPTAYTDGEIKSAQAEGVRFIVKDNQLRVTCPHCSPRKIKVTPKITIPNYRGRRSPLL